jgi:hypothetical protein
LGFLFQARCILLGKDDGPSIEEYIKSKSHYGKRIGNFLPMVSKKMLPYGGNHLTLMKMMALSNEAYEKLFLDKWSHAKKKDKESTKGLFSCGNSILQVHGCIHKEKVIVSINPSCQHNFINVHLAKRLQVPTKHIQSTQVEGENVQIFKYLKLTMDKYVLHSDFHAIDMNDVDVILGYPWMESIGTININVQKKFLKLWYKKKKITLQDISLTKQEGPKGHIKEVLVGKIIAVPI